ncbi:MAG: hypothetical protein QGG54_18875 [Gammaproteobacteria bacterium]|jgi:hypothetical protein|nr:hypothetical protein [Gammaproteobacteria bacterium]
MIPEIGFKAVAVTMAVTESIVCIGIMIYSGESLKTLLSSFNIVVCLMPAAVLMLLFPYFPAQESLRIFLGATAALLGIVALLASPVARAHRREVASIKNTI